MGDWNNGMECWGLRIAILQYSSTPSLHYSNFFSQISLLLVILLSARMERHSQRTFLRALAELAHIERLVVIDRNKFLLCIDGFDGGVRDSVRQPFVGHQRPAAEVDGRDILVKLTISALRQDRATVAQPLELFDDIRFDGDDLVTVLQRLIQPSAHRADAFIE